MSGVTLNVANVSAFSYKTPTSHKGGRQTKQKLLNNLDWLRFYGQNNDATQDK